MCPGYSNLKAVGHKDVEVLDRWSKWNRQGLSNWTRLYLQKSDYLKTASFSQNMVQLHTCATDLFSQ